MTCFSSSRSSLRRLTTLSAALAGEPFTASQISARAWSVLAISSSAPTPVTASIRRTPAATPPSLTTLKTPISPVRSTCVPPHSSTEKRSVPIVNTRTSSPYFSPNSAVAPASMAASMPISWVSTSELPRTWSFTIFATCDNCSPVTASPWEKSKRSLSASTKEPFC